MNCPNCGEEVEPEKYFKFACLNEDCKFLAFSVKAEAVENE